MLTDNNKRMCNAIVTVQTKDKLTCIDAQITKKQISKLDQQFFFKSQLH